MEKRDHIIAIDLGSSDIVAAAGRLDSGGLTVEGVAIHPSDGISMGEVKNAAQAANSVKKAVKELEEKTGIPVWDAFIGLSGCHVRCIEHPYYVYVSGKDGEIVESDVKALNDSMQHVQVSDGYTLLHTIPQHYLVDDEEEATDPVGMFGRTLGSVFNLIVGNSTILGRSEKTLERNNISLSGIFVNPLAVAEAVTYPEDKELGVAVVDLGAGNTDVCIYQNGVVRYVGVIPLGIDAINKDIRSHGILEPYVEELKVKWGCAMPEMIDGDKLVIIPGRTSGDNKDISLKNLASIINARLTDIIDYVIEEIKNSGYYEKLDAGIVLTGGGALVKEIAALVEKRTGMEVRIGTPKDTLGEESDDILSDPRISAAIGTLMMAARNMGITRGHIKTNIGQLPPPTDNTVEIPEPDETVEITADSVPNLEEEDVIVKIREPRVKWGQKFKERFERLLNMEALEDDEDEELD